MLFFVLAMYIINEELRFRGDRRTATLPESICSRPCNESQAKKYVEGEGCCWTCVECTHYQVRTLTTSTSYQYHILG